MEKRSKKAMLEAVLFQAAEPLHLDKIMRLIGSTSPDKVEVMLKEVQDFYAGEEHGVQLFNTETGWQFRVKPEYVSAVRGLTPFHDLSRGLLRVLALVAYKQPITQSQIVKVIGNRTYEYVKELERRGMLRAIKSGRSKALVTTKGFADYFGLNSPEDAKKLFESIPAEPEKKEPEEATSP
ncbi:MAG: SMC-Scp complex subunit ScpB [Candidatus Aenigmatarchaeota archaeon]